MIITETDPNFKEALVVGSHFFCGTETYVSLADYNEDKAVWGGVCGVPSFCHSENKKT